jgi:hypothetical protein
MSDEYIRRDPGDLITAEDWNEVQKKIQEDIGNKIQSAKEEITETGVSRADDADKFDKKTPKDWTDELDERYAPKSHDHEGQNVRFKCFKRFTQTTPTAFIHHDLGQFPLVDIYALAPVPQEVMESEDVQSSDGKPIKFFLYYHKEEADKFKLKARVYREEIELGIPLEAVLSEYGVEWEEDDTLEDVRNELWKKLFAPQNDTISYASSPWIRQKCIERLKIKKLIDGGEWGDIRLVFIPHKYELIFAQLNYPSGEVSEKKESTSSLTWIWNGLIRFDHVNYNTLFLAVLTEISEIPDDAPLDLMVLLRI